MKIIKGKEELIEKEDDVSYLLICTAEELRSMRFLSNKEIIIGQHVVSYYSGFSLENYLVTHHISDTSENDENFLFAGEVRPLSNSDSLPGSSMETMIQNAMDYFFQTIGAPFRGQPIKIVSESEPIFLREIYGLQDAMHFAAEDWGLPQEESQREELFGGFVSNIGYWWVADYCGVPKAFALLHSFYDAYLPLLKEHISRITA